MGFPRQECWSGLSFASPRDLSYSGIEPRFPAWQADYLLLGHLESPYRQCDINRKTLIIRNQITEIGRLASPNPQHGPAVDSPSRRMDGTGEVTGGPLESSPPSVTPSQEEIFRLQVHRPSGSSVNTYSSPSRVFAHDMPSPAALLPTTSCHWAGNSFLLTFSCTSR